MSPVRRLFRREDGTAAIEFALIGMLLIGVSVGTIEIGRALFLYNELAHAADRAARLLLINPDILLSDLRDQVRDDELLTGLSALDLDVEEIDSGSSFRTVELSYEFTPMISGLTIGPLTLSADRRVPK